MVPYVFLVGYILCVLILKRNGFDVKARCGSVFDFSILFILFVFFAIRYEVGFDYSAYVTMIENGWYDSYAETRYEYLSYWFMDIAHAEDNPQLFFILIAGVALPLYYYALSRYTEIKDSYICGILCYLAMPIGFMYSLSISRQFAASAILLYGTRYLIKRNLLKYALCVLVAMMFHTASILALSAYLITAKRFHMRYFIYLGIIGVFLSLAVQSIVITFFPVFTNYVQAGYGDHSSGWSQIMLYSIMAIPFIIVRSTLLKYKYYDMYLKLYLLGMVLCYIFIPIDAALGARIGAFGLIYACFLYPYFFMAFKEKNIVRVLVVCFFLLLYFYGLSITAEGTYIPYKTVLS